MYACYIATLLKLKKKTYLSNVTEDALKTYVVFTLSDYRPLFWILSTLLFSIVLPSQSGETL